MRITAAQLQLLLEVVEQGSIGKAATLIGLSQSAASQSLSTLEKSLGVQLLTRDTNGVTPTAFTLAILDKAHFIIENIQQIELEASKYRNIAQEPKSVFSIASIPSIAQHFLPSWSKRLKQLYPHVPISFFEGSHTEVGEWVMSGIAEVGLTSIVPNKANATLLYQEQLLAVVALNNNLSAKKQITLADLIHTPIITPAGCDCIVEAFFKERDIPLPKLIKIQDVTTALKMTKQNLGTTILPESSFPRSDLEHLRCKVFDPPITRELYLIQSEHTVDHSMANQLIHIIKSRNE